MLSSTEETFCAAVLLAVKVADSLGQGRACGRFILFVCCRRQRLPDAKWPCANNLHQIVTSRGWRRARDCPVDSSFGASVIRHFIVHACGMLRVYVVIYLT